MGKDSDNESEIELEVQPFDAGKRSKAYAKHVNSMNTVLRFMKLPSVRFVDVGNGKSRAYDSQYIIEHPAYLYVRAAEGMSIFVCNFSLTKHFCLVFVRGTLLC